MAIRNHVDECFTIAELLSSMSTAAAARLIAVTLPIDIRTELLEAVIVEEQAHQSAAS